jgi:hypothetical protein
VGEGAEGGEAQNADELVTRPVVFQCKRCRSILGDSLALVGVNPVLQVVVLARTRGVRLSDKLEMSRDAADDASTFHAAYCESCGSHVGRVFRTTPATLDPLRDMYSLDRSALQSYQIGSGGSALDFAAPTRSPATAAPTTILPGTVGGGAEGAEGHEERIAGLEAAVVDLRTELGKAQRMILVLARFSRTSDATFAPGAAGAAGTTAGFPPFVPASPPPLATASALPRVAGSPYDGDPERAGSKRRRS